MSAILFTDETNTSIFKSRRRKQSPNRFVFGKKVGLAARLCGCWHDNISRPFVLEKTGYRSCLRCGARKQFNPETLETYGAFYFPPLVQKERV
ncbi:MAG: hypothetical protein ACR2LT_03830 [Pyrinomonadaceae bacterium]